MSDERSTNRHANICIQSYKLLENAWLAASLATSESDAAYNSWQTRFTKGIEVDEGHKKKKGLSW